MWRQILTPWREKRTATPQEGKLENADETEVQSVVDEWKKRFEKTNQQEEAVFYASVGMATGKGAEIESVIRQADERMYIEKRKRSSTERK